MEGSKKTDLKSQDRGPEYCKAGAADGRAEVQASQGKGLTKHSKARRMEAMTVLVNQLQ